AGRTEGLVDILLQFRRFARRLGRKNCFEHRAFLGRRGGGHELGQVRLGPARLAHCMRWIGQVETALELMIDRALKRFTHGSLLADKQ
ncbi:hypothetical protein Q8G48_28485, partial [Klebsiella pneumoniae]